jgi:hypothetical protein
MQKNEILEVAGTALQSGDKIKLNLKSGEFKKAWVLNILNNTYIIIKERNFILSKFSVIELHEISGAELFAK